MIGGPRGDDRPPEERQKYIDEATVVVWPVSNCIRALRARWEYERHLPENQDDNGTFIQ